MRQRRAADGSARANYRRFSPEERAEIRRRHHAGETEQAIGLVLKRSRQSIHDQIKWLRERGELDMPGGKSEPAPIEVSRTSPFRQDPDSFIRSPSLAQLMSGRG